MEEGSMQSFMPTGEESGGHWDFKKKVEEKWRLRLSTPLSRTESLTFKVMTTPGRHLGVFPEVAAHWDWFSELVHHRVHEEHRETNVLNLFGYTGLATLGCGGGWCKSDSRGRLEKIRELGA